MFEVCRYAFDLHMHFYASSCGGSVGRPLQLTRNVGLSTISADICSFSLYFAKCRNTILFDIAHGTVAD